MNELPSKQKYLWMARCLSVGRSSIAALLISGLVSEIACRHYWLEFGKTLMNVFGIIIVMSAVGFFYLGSRIKCDTCNKNLVFTWSNNSPFFKRYATLSTKQKILDFFVPRAIKTRIVHCANCDEVYRL